MRMGATCIVATISMTQRKRISRSLETNNEALLASPWAVGLPPELKRRVARETVVRSIPSGGLVCRKGEPATDWIGVMRGLVKVYGLNAEGKSTTFIGVPAGGWFGEGALLKSERRLYDAVALRPSEIAYVPRNTAYFRKPARSITVMRSRATVTRRARARTFSARLTRWRESPTNCASSS